MIVERHLTLRGWRWQVVGADLEPSCAQLSFGKWKLLIVGSYHPAIPGWLQYQILNGEEPVEVLSRLWDQYDGHCVVFLIEEGGDQLVVGVDPYAIAKIYVYSGDGRWLIGSRLVEVMRYLPRESLDLDPYACAYFLVKGYTPARHTFYTNITKVPPGTILAINGGQPSQRCYLDIWGPAMIPGNEYLTLVRQTWERSLAGYLNGFDSHYVALSGGIDSTLLLASLLKLGMDPGLCVAKTFVSLGGDGDIVLNPYDVEFAERVAGHYGVKHVKIPYSWSAKRVLADFQRTVQDLGTEDAIGSLMFQTLASPSYSPKSGLYAAQNADSIFSFASIGWPMLKAKPPFVTGLGGWLTRFNLFGGLDQGCGFEGCIARAMLELYLRRHYQMSLRDRTPVDRLFGMVFNTLKWPIHLNEEKLPYLADISGLSAWFEKEYINGANLMSLFDQNPHGAFVWLFLHNYMQGTANRGTVWPTSVWQMPSFLPFASLGILRLTTRLIPDFRFHWFGKYAVVWMARECYEVPEWVIWRLDPPTSEMDRVMLETFFRNHEMYEYLSSLFSQEILGRFHRIIDRIYLGHLVERFKNRQFNELNTTLLLRLSWILTLEQL